MFEVNVAMMHEANCSLSILTLKSDDLLALYEVEREESFDWKLNFTFLLFVSSKSYHISKTV